MEQSEKNGCKIQESSSLSTSRQASLASVVYS